jgi:hypothetical protein
MARPLDVLADFAKANAARAATKKAREHLADPKVQEVVHTMAKHAPTITKASKVMRQAERFRRMRGRSRAPRRGTCRSVGSRRASGVRSSQDPGDSAGDDHPPGSLGLPPARGQIAGDAP